MSDYPAESTESLPLLEATAEPAWESAQRGIDQAERNANEDWKEAALECVRTAAKQLHELTADDVLELLEKESVETHNMAALGPVFLRAAKRGWIRNSNRMVQSRIPRRHRKITVWESLIY